MKLQRVVQHTGHALEKIEKDRDGKVELLGKASERYKKNVEELQTKLEEQSAIKLAEARLTNELQKIAAAKDAEIQELKTKFGTLEVTQKLAITEAVNVVEKQRDELKNNLERVQLEKQLAESLALHQGLAGAAARAEVVAFDQPLESDLRRSASPADRQAVEAIKRLARMDIPHPEVPLLKGDLGGSPTVAIKDQFGITSLGFTLFHPTDI